jgi:hypothetical protein
VDRDDRVQARPRSATDVQLLVVQVLEVALYRGSSVPSVNRCGAWRLVTAKVTTRLLSAPPAATVLAMAEPVRAERVVPVLVRVEPDVEPVPLRVRVDPDVEPVLVVVPGAVPVAAPA